MLGTVLEKTSGLVQRRFLLNAVVPSLAFWGSLYVLVVLDRGDLPQTIRLWGDQPATLQLVEALAIVVWLLFFASVLAATMTRQGLLGRAHLVTARHGRPRTLWPLPGCRLVS